MGSRGERIDIQKHGPDFTVAALVFAVTESDDFVGTERRWQTTGLVQASLLVVVIHLLREEDDNQAAREVVRIVSARAADRKERRKAAGP